ncbi:MULTISPECIES: DUF3619 family protein [unclassified Variovorax]|uniref:DUF3619 family protein n=1 Tax=unclassified Variovorax TaxID=663243 RepID=UPI001BD26864|nr:MULTISPECIES: DUF3619 family protein [unclassified Variovorax]
MNATLSKTSSALEEQFARRLTARLSAGSAELPHDIGERLRVARQQAVARRKIAPALRPAQVIVPSGGAVALGGWWTRVGAVVPLVALVVGLITISIVQDENRVNDMAEVDAALLTDDLPPAAFTDPGFAQFLKTDASDTASH